MIPLSRPWIDQRTEEAVVEVLRSGQLAAGPKVAELEHRFADLTGTGNAIAVSSGTAALEMALEVSVEPGEVVITTPFTFAATLNAALRAGATVRFADIGADFNIDVSSLAAQVDDRVSAVLPVHLYGLPCDMTAISDLADTFGIAIVEDAAQAIGADAHGRSVGSWGIGCFSLYATKNVTSGEGGVITTNDEESAGRLRTFANQGSADRYEYVMRGTNRRLTDLQAAVALAQMDELKRLTEARRQNAIRLSEGLKNVPGLITPQPVEGHVFHQYTVRITDEARVSRDQLRTLLSEAGISTGVYYPRPVYDYDCYRKDPAVEITDTPQAWRACREVLSLPVFPGLTRDEVDQIIAGVREVLCD